MLSSLARVVMIASTMWPFCFSPGRVQYDGNAQPEFAFGMSLINPPTYQQLQSVCKGSYWNATPGE
jgi:hypothetical protein